jgi:acyl-CoA hydrolase
MVNLKGNFAPERAQALISVANPDFREDLERQAYENRLIPRGFFSEHSVQLIDQAG